MSEASEDTNVQIKGTFSQKKRELNGLNTVAEYMNANRVERVPVVGYVEFVRHVDTVQGDELTVALVAVEPVIEPDGSDPHGRARVVRQFMEASRKSAGKAPVADTLFTKDEEKQLDGQLEALTRDDAGEKNASGDAVPEASGEEVMAERAEARAQATADDEKRKAAAAARPDLAGALTDSVKDARANLTSVTGKPLEIVKPGYVAENEAKAAEGAADKPARKPRGATVRPPATADPFETPKADS